MNVDKGNGEDVAEDDRFVFGRNIENSYHTLIFN